jgi:probable phosphoglycerate mutase
MRHVLYLARHGETDWNAAGRWQGHTDVPLNDNGRAQARAMARAMGGLGVAGIVTSDLTRARETGAIVATELKVAFAYEDADLRERGFGVFEGLTPAECERLHAEAWRVWMAERRAPAGAESQGTFAARVTAAIGRAAARATGERAPWLLVTHGGALRAAVAKVGGTMPPLLKNGAIWRVIWEEGAIVEACAQW